MLRQPLKSTWKRGQRALWPLFLWGASAAWAQETTLAKAVHVHGATTQKESQGEDSGWFDWLWTDSGESSNRDSVLPDMPVVSGGETNTPTPANLSAQDSAARIKILDRNRKKVEAAQRAKEKQDAAQAQARAAHLQALELAGQKQKMNFKTDLRLDQMGREKGD